MNLFSESKYFKPMGGGINNKIICFAKEATKLFPY